MEGKRRELQSFRQRFLALNLTDLGVGKERKEQLWCLWRKVGESGLRGVQRAPAACARQAAHTSRVLPVSWVCSVVPFRAGTRLPDRL